MATFIVSLYLPNTFSFDQEEPDKEIKRVTGKDPNAPEEKSIGDILQVPDLSGLSIGRRHEPPTPREEPGDFLLKNKAHPGASSPRHKNGGMGELSMNDPQSPSWGQKLVDMLPGSSGDTAEKSDGRQRRRANANSLQPSPNMDDQQWFVQLNHKGNGGLKNAVKAAMREGSTTPFKWVGTLGVPMDSLDGTKHLAAIEKHFREELDSYAVHVKDDDFTKCYNRYCKQILWPIFHYQVPDNPKDTAYLDHSYPQYLAVNRAFADVVIANYKPGDRVMVNDYHLLLVPKMIRDSIPDAEIGLYLHVAFPSSEIFRCLAARKELLEGMLGASLVGFQTSEYSRHFLQTCGRLLRVEPLSNGIQMEDRFCEVTDQPIGADPFALRQIRTETDIGPWIEQVEKRFGGSKIIFARDKMDAIRGIEAKLLAFERFLEDNPEWVNKVVLVQVATSPTENPRLETRLNDLVGRINSTFATFDHQPVVFIRQDIRYPQYLGMLTTADVLMVSSLREGMNLTSHEFVCCQDGEVYKKKKHGALILSEFTGTATIFDGAELTINPWYQRGCAVAIKMALEMPASERERRWNLLNAAVTARTAGHWLVKFLATLDAAYQVQRSHGTSFVPRLVSQELVDSYRATKSRLFLLDYEGTLHNYGNPNKIILSSPQRLLTVLSDLMADEHNMVYVLSHRTPEEVDKLFLGVPDIGLVAENGCFIREFAHDHWMEMADPVAMNSWKVGIADLLRYYRERTEGLVIEQRHCSVIIHLDGMDDQEAAARITGDIVEHINESCAELGVRAVPVPGAVLVENVQWNKATAAEHILASLREEREGVGSWEPDFMLVAGDSREDEPLFKWANGLAHRPELKHLYTVFVGGSRNTEAKAVIPQGPSGLLKNLTLLTKGSLRG